MKWMLAALAAFASALAAAALWGVARTVDRSLNTLAWLLTGAVIWLGLLALMGAGFLVGWTWPDTWVPYALVLLLVLGGVAGIVTLVRMNRW